MKQVHSEILDGALKFSVHCRLSAVTDNDPMGFSTQYILPVIVFLAIGGGADEPAKK